MGIGDWGLDTGYWVLAMSRIRVDFNTVRDYFIYPNKFKIETRTGGYTAAITHDDGIASAQRAQDLRKKCGLLMRFFALFVAFG